ncbi:hypothetical protein D9619_009031 [Psilocybe cf. subviscida]|uniref:Nephrocystin 3-like N-terminal domain-containing protein n=1 Tax=Psilocybe cf. subviscida TaxID=2480587 RepID=A0A8H5BTE6_9AGAR|nr:hypothetical protein D9619_009031 [Psilocybe cf. subviscida]
MSVLTGAANTTIHNGNFTAVSTTVANIGAKNDVVTLLHFHSATAGLLDAKERFDAPKCDEGTRTSMIYGMKNFVQDGDACSSSAVYWLHGPAGVGKSAIAQSLSLLLQSEGDHAASFFFSRTSTGRNNGDQLIVTLAYQLATNFPPLRRFMSKIVQTNPAILTASNTVQMQKLIIDPINRWHKRYKWSVQGLVHRLFNNNKKLHPRLILVDGLDECNDRDVQSDLILCIGLAVHQLSIPFRFVIASRPEAHILATFELDPAFQGIDGVNVTKQNLGDDEDADEQIMTFLVKKFAEIRRVHPIRDFLPQQWPRIDQIEQLVAKSSKGFIYPTTVIRYIKMPNNRPDECLERILGLSAIPTSDKPYEPLDGLYRHIFESVPEINKPSIHEIFHFLVLPSTWNGVTTSTTIERHFDYKPGHVQHVLRDLLCLVAFTGDGYIKVLHASLPDFLLDKSRSGPLYIDPADAHGAIAASYLLGICRGNELPVRRSGFADFLEHIMQANAPNMLLDHRILKMDLLTRYRKVYNGMRVTPRVDSQPSLYTRVPDPLSSRMETEAYTTIQLSGIAIEGVAFMMAYLLVLVIRCGPQKYIVDQIATIKAYALQIYPFATSVDAVHNKIVPVMTPLFCDWSSTIYHESINRIFACELAPSQNRLREAIFELHLLMMAPFYNVAISEQLLHKLKAPGVEEQVAREGLVGRNYWASIVRGVKRSNQIPPSDSEFHLL